MACWPSVVQAGQAYNPFTGRTDLCVTVQEVDASPSNGGCGTLTVTNGSLTDNGDGTYALAVPSTSDLVLTDTSPSLQFCDSSDNTAYLFHADTAAVYPFALYQGTCASGVFAVAPSRPLLAFDTSRRLILMDQFNGGGTQCLQVNNQGLVTGTGSACGGGGGGSGTVTSITAGTGLTGGTITTSGTIALSTPVSVANGGTGAASYTSNGVLYGQGTSALAVTAQGGTNTVLTANAGAPSFSNSPALTAVSVTNNVQWLPATGTQFEAYASGSEWFLTDVTSGNVILRVDNNDNIFSTQTIDLSGATLKGIVPNREFVWTASSTLPLEFSADAIPPITKNTGTNVDNLSVDYDDTALECREVTFQIPANVNTNGTLIFTIVWYPATAVANNVVWDIRYLMRATGQTWDAALTTYTFPASTASSTSNVVTILTQQVPIGTIGWTTGSNYVLCELCRNGGNAGDTLVGDAKLIQFGISIPRLR